MLWSLIGTAYGAENWKEAPITGITYNTKERSALTFECDRTSQTDLHCKFVQVSVRKKLTKDALSAKLAESDKQVATMTLDEKECKDLDKVVADFEAGKVDRKVDPRDADFGREMFAAFKKACVSGSRDDLRSVMRKEVERDLRACNISTNSFEQDFQRSDGTKPERPVWVTKAEAVGPCGIVQLSRFEREPGKDDFPFWNYIARKAVTNPNAELPLLGKCSNFDEDTYTFSWKSSDGPTEWAECDRIEFSVL